jgi:hypothetical protein
MKKLVISPNPIVFFILMRPIFEMANNVLTFYLSICDVNFDNITVERCSCTLSEALP